MHDFLVFVLFFNFVRKRASDTLSFGPCSSTRTIDMTKSRVAVIIYCLVRFPNAFFPTLMLSRMKVDTM